MYTVQGEVSQIRVPNGMTTRHAARVICERTEGVHLLVIDLFLPASVIREAFTRPSGMSSWKRSSSSWPTSRSFWRPMMQARVRWPASSRSRWAIRGPRCRFS